MNHFPCKSIKKPQLLTFKRHSKQTRSLISRIYKEQVSKKNELKNWAKNMKSPMDKTGRCSVSLVIRNMETTIIMKHYFHICQTGRKLSLEILKAGEDIINTFYAPIWQRKLPQLS